jgi:uncharacterized phosphosugar-binding protein
MKKFRTAALLLLPLTLFTGTSCLAADAIITPTPPAPSLSAPAQASAEAYYQWITQCINTIESQMPTITRSAQRAADLYVSKDYDIAVYGGQDFTRELFNRSGGMMQLTLASPLPGTGQEVISRVNLNKYIILIGLRESRWMEDVYSLRRLRKQKDKFLVGFGTAAQLARAETDGVWFDAQVTNGAAPANGLFTTPLTGPLVPTDSVANVAVGWTWLAEFVAANTRLGKMPTMYQGYDTGPSAYEREKKFAKVKFHEEKPAVIEPGRFGKEYLATLRNDLRQIHDLEMDRIRQAARQAIATRDAGGTLYTYMQGHVTMDLYPHPHDPGYFQNFERDWGTMRRDVKLAKDDFVLCIGQSKVFRGPDYEDFADVARKAGAKLTWAFSGFNRDEVNAVAPDESLIDMHWERGDAAVTMPGYDVRILPTSGVLQVTILWMVNSEMLGILESRLPR